MWKKLLGHGAMEREDTEQDVEKAETSTTLGRTKQDLGQGESSTKPRKTESDVGKSESSTKSIKTQPDNGKAKSSIEPTKTEQGVELAESSSKPGTKEVTRSGPTSPTFPTKSDVSSCIFRIPRSLANLHHKGHEPEIVSIGPYHHNKEHLQMIVKDKNRFLQLFLAEATTVGVNVLKEKILSMENDIKNSYSEKPVWVDEEDFANMMLRDGCFILMLFFFVTRRVNMNEKSPHDPILTTPWILPTIRSDLLLLENQVPLILLETLFNASKFCHLGAGGLNNLAFKFFNFSMGKPEGYWTKFNNLEAEHLLDLIRKTFIPISSSNGSSHNATDTSSSSESFLRLILSAKRLRLQGIKFKASHDPSSGMGCCKITFCCFSNESHTFVARSPLDKTILDIQLKGNELQIPPIVCDEFISSVLLNCVAFEQLSSKCSNDITNYVVFMGCLMNDEADATYLIEKGIIENYFGNGNDVSEFFGNISKGIAYDLNKSYLKEVYEGINKYTSRKWNVQWARFKHLHFDSPWTCMSSSAVLAILLLTIFQATFAGLSYFRPPKQPSDASQ